MIKKIKSWLFENRHTKQIVVKNTLWLSIGTVASRAIKALIIIYAARILGTGNYGIFSYALSLAALFSIFADIGMSAVLTREISKNPELLEKNLSTAFVIKLFLVGVSVIFIVFVSPFFSTIKGAVVLMPLAALLIAFDALREFGFSITRAKEKMEVEAGINLTTGLGITIFGFMALAIKPTAFSLMIGYVAGSGLGFVLAFLLLKKYLKGFWKFFDKALAKRIFKEAVPFALIGLLGVITVNTDIVMIGWLRDASAVGLYSAALRIVSLIYLIPALLATSTFPLISRLAKKDDERARSVLEKTVSISLLIAIPIFVGGTILALPIISFLFGVQYISAAATFAVLLFTLILIFPASIINNAIFAYNEQKILIWALLVGTIGNAIFDYLLIKPFGILGSSFATVISQSLAFGLIWMKMKKVNNFYILRHIKKGLLAVVAMGGLSFAMNLVHVHVLANIIISAFVYLGILILLKEKLVEETKIIFHLKNLPSAPEF